MSGAVRGCRLNLDLHTLGPFTLLWATCVPIPGANQLMVMHVALAHGRAQLVPAIFGNVVAILAMAAAALAGLAVLLNTSPHARLFIGIAGALYLVYFGGRLFRRSRVAAAQLQGGTAPEPRASFGQLFLTGMLTALSNSQAVIFITSVFAASGILDSNLATGIAGLGIMGAMNAIWLGSVGVLLTFEAPRRAYARYKSRVEATVGVLFVGFGLRLLWRELLPMLA